MRSLSYSVLLADICDMMGWNPDELDARQFASIRGTVSRGLALIWDCYWWAGLCRCEKRTFAPAYSPSATYSAGDFVWLPGPARYFQALQSTTGNPPAVQSGQVWVTDLVNWADATEAPGASWWDATITYAVGDRVQWRETGLVYQAISAGSGNLPSGSAWAQIIPFDGFVNLLETGFTALGRVRAVYDRNPRLYAGASRLEWAMSDRGLEVFTNLSTVWVDGLMRPHVLTGSAYDPAAAYTAATDVSGATAIALAADTSGAGYAGVISLRARTEHTANQMAYLLFVATEGDGGGGWFRFVTSETDADDGVDVIKPDNIGSGDPGRWVRV
jgi:hypothetical protein